jgi:hypothetical protein
VIEHTGSDRAIDGLVRSLPAVDVGLAIVGAGAENEDVARPAPPDQISNPASRFCSNQFGEIAP